MTKEKRRPPYVPWKTLRGFLDRLKKTALPSKIDTSLMTGMSGSVQNHLQSAMKFLGLIEGDGSTTERLRELVATLGTEQWHEALAEAITQAYLDITQDLDLGNGTSTQLKDAFRLKGAVDAGMLEKSIRFYLSAMEEAKVQLSPHFTARGNKTVRPTNGPRRTVRRRGVDSGSATPEKQNLDKKDEVVPPGFIAHPFPLRRDLTITLTLPADLTTADVERIYKWLSALPVE